MKSDQRHPWGHGRRFNAYGEYFRKEFGERVQKISIDAGFTCPNRDGTKGRGGCSYCLNDAFNPSYCQPEKPVATQIREGIEFHKIRYRRAKKYLAYFQPYSNTHAPLEKLKEIYDQALRFPEVTGLVIGTRPDCIDEEKLSYFRKLSAERYIILEYGIESCYDRTLERINRQHSLSDAIAALELTRRYGIRTGAHLIFGLPGETPDDMLKEAEILSALPIDNIKFHQLQIFRGTPLEREFRERPEDFYSFSLEEYIDFIIDFTERLTPRMVIERFAGEVPPRFLAGPSWGLIRNDQILHKIEKRMEERDTWQGKLFCC